MYTSVYTHTHTLMCVRSSIQYTAQHTLLKVSTVKKVAILIPHVKKILQ